MVRAVLADGHSLGGSAAMGTIVPRVPKSYPCSPLTSTHQSLPESARVLGPRAPPAGPSLPRQAPLLDVRPDPRRSGLVDINPAE